MKRILAVLLVLSLTGCASSGPLKNLSRTGNEALVVGRVLITYNGEPASANSTLLLRKTQHLEENRNQYFYRSQGQGPDMAIPFKLDETGLLVTRLPLGYYAITTLRCRPVPGSAEAEYKIYEEDTTFGLTDASRTYYIGDIYVDWKGPKMKIWTIGDELGLTGKKGKNDGELKLSVADRFADIQRVLLKKYGETPNYERTLLKLPVHREPGATTEPRQEGEKKEAAQDGQTAPDTK